MITNKELNKKEAKSAISNELIWAKGSSSKEEAEMHLGNAQVLEQYVELLQAVKTTCGAKTDKEEEK